MPFTCVCCCCALHMCQCLASYSIDDWKECLGCRTSRRKDPWGFSAGESGLTCRASCLEHCLANSGVPLPGRVRMAAEMATCTHLLAVSCGFERFIHIWCLASETTLEGAEVDRCGRHRQHAAGTPLDLPFLPRSICRRQTTGDAAWLCASSMFPSPAPLRCPGTDRVSLPVSLRNGETRMAAARAHAHATLADWGQQPTS
jgi:hypothetical protein